MATLENTQQIAAATLGTTLADRIGNTPMVRLEKLAAHLPGITLLGKAEWVNPGGSVKDRAASGIVGAALERGLLGASRHLLDATSGNTGIAYAMLGAAWGFPVTLCVPSNVSPERKRILHAYGANVIWTDPGEGSDGAIRKARELAEDTAKYFYANQYGNDENWKAHYRGTMNNPGTANEIWQHMASAIVPPIYDPTAADRDIEMETEAAYAMAKRLGRVEGLLVGISAAGAVAAALRVAEEEHAKGREAVIVTILCDGADKYLSERFWNE
jgi:cysteine synthase B